MVDRGFELLELGRKLLRFHGDSKRNLVVASRVDEMLTSGVHVASRMRTLLSAMSQHLRNVPASNCSMSRPELLSAIRRAIDESFPVPSTREELAARLRLVYEIEDPKLHSNLCRKVLNGHWGALLKQFPRWEAERESALFALIPYGLAHRDEGALVATLKAINDRDVHVNLELIGRILRSKCRFRQDEVDEPYEFAFWRDDHSMVRKLIRQSFAPTDVFMQRKTRTYLRRDIARKFEAKFAAIRASVDGTAPQADDVTPSRAVKKRSRP